MEIFHEHSWDLTIAEAKVVQEKLKNKVILEDQLPTINYVAGVDVSYDKQKGITQAAIAVLNFPQLELQTHALARCKTAFPYVPGYLSFREIPAILEALNAVTIQPDLILCDGQGTAHPRRLGIACHLGVLINKPTIGVAKSWLTGDYEQVPLTQGSWQPLTSEGETIGAVLRTRTGIKPVFVSPGHQISLPTAIRYTLACTSKYRLPETTRWADKLAALQ
ncbi:deoxyribonuclease V [Merismopedia glauca]|uniref:Endonuclease V n=1 Tax=Merismopedia glauca CCAP 1448/3 TaxID=1296344 RepID=A0A2T1C0J6_9CYAN|nr:deoxyribonuclease V [Merismopedia glauca]PSB01805.1 deoxyribonuclease V [Merismopedia glauca CCAP 1448/3]